MSLSIPTTCAPSFANCFTVSEPINPADPVTMIVLIYSRIIANTILPRNPSHIAVRNGSTLLRQILRLTACAMSEKINIPGDIGSDLTRIEGNQTTGSYERQIHIQAVKRTDKSFPANARLRQ